MIAVCLLVCLPGLVHGEEAGTPGNSEESALWIAGGVSVPLINAFTTAGPTVSARVLLERPGSSNALALSVDGAAFVLTGGRRMTGHMTASWRRYAFGSGFFAQLGLGVAAYHESLSLDLQMRTVDGVDLGAAMTGEAALGWTFTPRWQLEIAYRHNLVGTVGMSHPGQIAVLLGGRP